VIDPAFLLPSPNLSDEEAIGLLLLAHKVRHHIQHPLSDAILRAAHKIQSNLPRGLRQFCSKALSVVTVKSGRKEDATCPDRLFLGLIRAILDKKVLNIHYASPDRPGMTTLQFCSYHLIHTEDGWYVLGRPQQTDGLTALRLSQIRDMQISGKLFVQDERYDVNDYLGRAWSMRQEGRLYHIKLRFLPEVAGTVARIQWHSTQTVEFLKDGSAILQFRVDGLNEIVWWILSYGDRVQVLAPMVLRERVMEIARQTIQVNEGVRQPDASAENRCGEHNSRELPRDCPEGR
jgi:proteasome accessory factor B